MKKQENGKKVNKNDKSKENEIINEEVKKKDKFLSPLFLITLQSRKVVKNALEIFEVLK